MTNIGLMPEKRKAVGSTPQKLHSFARVQFALLLFLLTFCMEPIAAFAVPSAPNDLTANSGNAQVMLSWSAIASATHYKIYRRTSPSGTYVQIATSAQNNAVNPGLTNGVTYYYVVRACDNTGESGNSNEVTVTPYGPPPTNLIATPGDMSVTLSWSAPSGATTHKVFRATSENGTYTEVHQLSETSWTNTSLSNGTTYYFIVRSYNANGESAPSNIASAKPGAVPGAPTNVVAIPASKQITLTWDIVPGATSYRVWRALESNGDYDDVATVTTNSFVDSGRSNSITFYYKIKARNDAGEGPSSPVVSATPLLAAPTGLIATAGKSKVDLVWNAVAGADTYRIYRSTIPGGPYTRIQNENDDESWTDTTATGMINGVQYYYVVNAVDGSEQSPNSNEASATPWIIPYAPTGLVATAGKTRVNLSWNAVAGSDTYRVYRSTSPGGPYTRIQNENDDEDYTDTGVTNDVQYYYVVTTVDDSNESVYSNEASAIPRNTPSAPTSLTATPGNGQVSLSWNSVTYADSYAVWRKQGSGSYSTIATVSTNSYIDTTPTNGVSYTYIIRALNAGGESSNSNTATVMPRVTAPQNVTATPAHQSVTLTWDVVPGASSYRVKRGTSPGTYTSTQNVSGATTSTYTWTGLTNGTTYYFVVLARDNEGDGPDSAEVSAMPYALPGVPTGLSATAGNTQVDLSWNAVSGATSYVIQSKPNGGSYATIGTSETPSYLSEGLTNGTKYFYRVAAVSGAGTSGYSSEVNATPKLTVPAGLTATPGSGQVTLTWNAVPNAVSYRLKRGSSAGSYSTGITVDASQLSYDWTGLTNGTTYYFAIEAYAASSAGHSGESGAVSATPQTGTPINLTATPGNGKISLAWTAVGGASSYQVWRSTVSGSGYTQVGTPSGTSFTNSSLTNGTTYYYIVRAVSGGNTGAYSNEVSATPIAVMPTPLNLSATPGNQNVSLTWDPVPGATSYKIKRGTSTGSYNTSQTIAASNTSYTWSSLTNGTTYYFVVTAIGSAAESLNSNEVSAKPTAAPTAPTGLSATPGDASVDLSWTTVTGANSYNVKRSTTPGGPYTTVGSPGTNSYSDLGLTNGVTYYYVVSAVGYGGESANSSEVSATPVPPAPDGPDAPTLSELTGTSVKVTAPALPLNATELFLQCKLTGQGDEAYVLVEDGIGGGQATVVYGLDPGEGYTFRYVARNVSGLTPGTAASVTMPVAAIAWNAGTPISCGGIYFPESTANIAANAQGRVSAYLATDWDGREITLDGNTTSATFSDPCSYTWSFSGGSALNGITTGQNFIWVAPSTPGTYTITLTVDDQNNGNKSGGETGTRNDAQQGVDEDPVSFSVSVTVY